ncbi:MAG: hypothetical protein M4579_007426, partial [Chaenotheca gracillima]
MEDEAGSHSRKASKNGEAQDIQRRRELQFEKRAMQREQLEEQPLPSQEHFKTVDVKESILAVQASFLGKLAAEENHLKVLAEIPGLSIADFDERVKE